MRRTLVLVLCSLLLAAPVAAAPADVDHEPGIVVRALEVATEWLADLGTDWLPGGSTAKDESDNRDSDLPPLDGLGPEFDPGG